jgi:arsenical pump membrane protein
MQLAVALAFLAITIGLVLTRPTVGKLGRLHPALSAALGVAALGLVGHITVKDVLQATHDLWRPLVTVASVMMTTSAAHHMGIFDRLARTIEIRTRGPVPRAFTTVFVISVLTATAFNNDAAILLLSPIVVPVIRRLYPRRQSYLVESFAFAVFVAAGVAPFSTSNPMNLVVAERLGVDFNHYAVRMIPVAFATSLVSYAMLRAAFRKELEDAKAATGQEQGSLAPIEGEPLLAFFIVIGALASYPIISYFKGPVWVAALACATFTVGLGLLHGSVKVADVPRGVAWDILAFMLAIFLVATGLRNAGLLDALTALYRLGATDGARIAIIGATSALGSALLNNHPMAALNAHAVEQLPGDGTWNVLAALIGGDLGPRLLPMGSLAGLLWLDMVRRMDVPIRLPNFIRVGFYTGVPAIAVGLLMLYLETKLLP